MCKSNPVTAGYICEQPRAEFYQWIDAANVESKETLWAKYRRLQAEAAVRA